MAQNKKLSETTQVSQLTGGEYIPAFSSQGNIYFNITLLRQIITKLSLGLNNVDNTSDVDKPISNQTSSALSGKADVGHTHGYADITGLAQYLTNALAQKAAALHGHAISDVVGLDDTLSGKASVNHIHDYMSIDGLTQYLSTALSGKSDNGHGHAMSDVSGLSQALAAKADNQHQHAVADLTDFNQAVTDIVTSAISGKANTSHTHQISDVQNLTNVLAGKADSNHEHDMSQVTGLTLALDGKSDTDHQHEVSDVNGLGLALDGKSDTGHQHDITDVTGLGEILSSKADSSHQHTSNDITDFGEAVGFIVSTAIQQALLGNISIGIGDVIGLSDELSAMSIAISGKADATHSHAISDVNLLQNALDGKAPTSHNHPTSEIAGLDNTVSNINTKLTLPNGKVLKSKPDGSGFLEATAGTDFAGVDNKNSFSKPQKPSSASVSPVAGEVTWDLDTTQVLHIELSTNLTSLVIQNLNAGNRHISYKLSIAHGGGLLTWPAQIKFLDGVQHSLTYVAGKMDFIYFTVDTPDNGVTYYLYDQGAALNA